MAPAQLEATEAFPSNVSRHALQPAPTSDPSSTNAPAIELPELTPDRGRALSSTSSVISNTLGPPLIQHPPVHPSDNRPSSATNSSDHSFTPPTSSTSTPATSVRPSFSSYDRERPSSQGSSSRNGEDRTLSPSLGEERLPPIPQGELLSEPMIPPSTQEAPTSNPENAEPQTTTDPSYSTTDSSATSHFLLALSWLKARSTLSRTNVIQNTIALMALIVTIVATVYYGQRGDEMNKEMVAAAYRQDCWLQEDHGKEMSKECKEATEKPMPKSSYEKVKRGLEWVVQGLKGLGETRFQRPTEVGPMDEPESGTLAMKILGILPYLGVTLLALVAVGVGIVLLLPRQRRHRRAPASGFDLVRNAPPFTIIKEHNTGHHIGLKRRRGNKRKSALALDPDGPRKKSWEDHFEDLHNNPEWKEHLEDIATDEDGDFQHGELPGERIARTVSEFSDEEEADTASVLSKFKRTIRERLHRGDSGDSSLSALGAPLEPVEMSGSDDSDGEPTKHKRFRIKKGVTSVGMVHIGTGLGASVGGEIGQEMLVKGVNGPGDLMNAKGDLMVPTEPQDLSLTLTATGAGGGGNLFSRVA